MTEKIIRINKVLRELNISLESAVKYLKSENIHIVASPNTKINNGVYNLLVEKFKTKNHISASNTSNDNQPQMELNSHRLFIVIEQKERSTIVRDCITEKTYPCKKIAKLVGYDVTMQVRELDDPDKPKLSYSVLNDFVENKEYEFEILEKKENGYKIEYSVNYTSFIPFSFEKYIENNKIKLTIDKIDVDLNKLSFKLPAAKTIEVKKYSFYNNIAIENVFSIGEKYYFTVYGFRKIDDNTSILLLEHQGFKTTVKALPFQKEDNFPENVTCLVTKMFDNKMYLQQDRFSTFNNLYKEGMQYEFHVLSMENDGKSNSNYFLLEDNYGFNHKLYYHEFDNSDFESIEIDDKISLYLRKIDEKGFLVLYLNSFANQGDFITAQSVFEKIEQADNVKKYFYDLEEILQSRKFKHQNFSQLFEDYANKENLWIFSYLSFLDALIQNYVKHNELEKAIEFNNIYIAVEEWMLEGSDFLQKFSQEKKLTIIKKAEDQLAKAKAKNEALRLILDDKSDDYIEEVLKTLRLSSYLRGHKINIFKYIIFSTTEIANTRTLIEILLLLIKGDMLDPFDINNFINILQKRINVERYDLTPSLIANESKQFDENTAIAVQNIISVLGLQIILFTQSGNTPKAILKSAMMCRYISILCVDEVTKKHYLEKSIECITSSKTINLNPEVYHNFNIEKLSKLILAKDTSVRSENLVGNQLFNQNGSIYASQSGWAILSKQQDSISLKKKELKLNKLASFFDDKICVATPYDFDYNLVNNASIEDCFNNWTKYYSISNIKKSKKSKQSDNLAVGQKISVIAKNYLKNNNNILFLQITDPDFEGDGIIPANEIFKCYLDGINEIINPKDEFNAEIIKIDDKGRISFSILNDIWEKTLTEANINDNIDAKVLQINNKDIFLITENGHHGYLYNIDNLFDFEERKVYKFKIEDINYEKMSLNLKYVANSDSYFNEKSVLRQFLERSNILLSNEENELNEESIGHNYSLLIIELLKCIESYIYFEKDLSKKFEYFQLSKLIGSITRNPKSFYYDAIITYHLNVLNFKNADFKNSSFNFEPIDDKTLSFLKSLEKINEIYKYLNYFNKPDSIPDLILHRNDTENKDKLRLVNIILAHNLLLADDSDEIIFRRTKDLIYEYLTNEKTNSFSNLISPIQNEDTTEIENEIDNDVEELKIELTSLGKEGPYREFKTSFIYYAGSSSADVDKQSFVIMKTMAGFLNAKGGSLFLGVNDYGEIIGLENEYKYFSQSANDDKYEREIRSCIVKFFNKDVNSQIEFKFHKSLNLEYCEIIIPEYEKPVPLNDSFYQRQGNETRIITGNDLVLFFERKLQAKRFSDSVVFSVTKEIDNSNNSKSYSNIPEPIEIDLTQENPDFYVDQKTANDQLTIDYNVITPKVIAYLYIFINGKYLLSRKNLSDIKGAEEIVIYDNMKKGYLLQCYDNGCVNKVEVRTLLDKTFNFLYSGAFSLEGNLIGLFLIKEDCLIEVNTIRNEISYVKLFKTTDITAHTHLKLKGNNIVQEDFDKLDSFRIIDNIHSDKLSRITYSSKQRLGAKVNNPIYSDEIKYLNSL